jgi:hypothetical protein
MKIAKRRFSFEYAESSQNQSVIGKAYFSYLLERKAGQHCLDMNEGLNVDSGDSTSPRASYSAIYSHLKSFVLYKSHPDMEY